MVTQLQPDVRAYLHGGEVIKRYIKVEEVAYEYGFSVEETEYIAKAASSLYKLTRIHLVKKERFDEFMKHIYKVPGTNKQIIKKFARIGEASIIYSIGRHRFPTAIFGKGDFFILRASGQSMIEAGIDDGDLVVVKKQVEAKEGDIVVALVDNQNTLKRYFRDDENKKIILHPENKKMKDIIVDGCCIQGVACHIIKELYPLCCRPFYEVT